MTFAEMFPRDSPENPFEDCALISELGGEELFKNFMIAYHGYTPIQDDKTTVQTQITLFFETNRYKHNGMLRTTQLEYNPIQNYDMTETANDTHETNRNTSTETHATATDKVTQFNSDVLTVASGTDNTGGGTGTETATETTTHTMSRSGNIGVTTTQQMIVSERKVVDYNIVRTICDSLAEEITTILY